MTKAAPDGYTLLLATAANAINTTLYNDLKYDFSQNPECICSRPYVRSAVRMPKGRGRFQQKILAALRTASRPLDLCELIPGRGRSEKRRALRKLAAEGLVREVRPDVWIAKASQRPRGSKPRGARDDK